MKKLIIQGIIAGVLSALAGIIYQQVYQTAMYTEFYSVLNMISIIGACFLGSFLITGGYVLLTYFKKEKWTGWLNILITIATFASIISVIGITLPLDLESPELFPGLAIPMHFFPALAFFCIAPFFIEKQTIIKNHEN